jgi:hypothetical protein
MRRATSTIRISTTTCLLVTLMLSEKMEERERRIDPRGKGRRGEGLVRY